MNFSLFINYLDGKRKPELWNLDLTEIYKAGEQITVKLDRHRGHGQISFVIPEAHLEQFIEALRKGKD